MADTTGIKHYAAAGFPAVAISTSDEDRTISNILAAFPKREVLKVACIGGIVNARTGAMINDRGTYQHAFALAADQKIVLIVMDYQHTVKNPAGYRMLRDILPLAKKRQSLIVLIAPSWSLPSEIEHDIARIFDTLPTREELAKVLDTCLTSTGQTVTDIERSSLIDSASGLTMAEAESSIALAFVASKDGKFDASLVSAEKMKLVRQSGLCEITTPAKLSELGGLANVKACFTDEVLPNMGDVDLAISGIVFHGPAGTGKSLSARVIGGMLQWPVMRVDMASLKAKSGGIVGQSEKGIIELFKLARAVAPVVLFFDEIEKMFAGSGSNNDSGVSAGMLGVVLTALQEIRDNNEKIFIVATTNDIESLPAPLAGRLEIQFFVDLPGLSEREQIAAIKLARFSPNDVGMAAEIAIATAQFSGRELENVVRSAARLSRRNITADVIKAATSNVKPAAITRKDEMDRLRKWALANLRLANGTDNTAAHARTIERLDD